MCSTVHVSLREVARSSAFVQPVQVSLDPPLLPSPHPQRVNVVVSMPEPVRVHVLCGYGELKTVPYSQHTSKESTTRLDYHFGC
mmetsp:Transcript_682/g.1612  ORF Transcript_682/g.1612 Transcript_682/m.1612 type:complete len:84 (+) Transcript_682:255-506(+)